jgi:hypothetical protein
LLWLCSDASSFVTGLPMPVDGCYVGPVTSAAGEFVSVWCAASLKAFVRATRLPEPNPRPQVCGPLGLKLRHQLERPLVGWNATTWNTPRCFARVGILSTLRERGLNVGIGREEQR